MTLEKTRIIRLDEGQRRETAHNDLTVVLDIHEVRRVRRPPFVDLFRNHYEAIRRTCMRFEQPGVAVIAVDSANDCIAASLCMTAKPGQPNTAIIGRHGRADLYLHEDPTLSLRHLALLVHPQRGGTDLRFKLLDLRTRVAFEDEHGNRVEELVAEGPMFVRCGRYALFCLVTGDPSDWPEDAGDAWDCIPSRVYQKESDAEPDRWARQARGAPAEPKPECTVVHTVPGPVRASKHLLAGDEAPIGELHVRTDLGHQSLVIGHAAACQGILLGRYERCDVDGTMVLTDSGISRVHVLVVEIENRVYAVDTASTNGTWSHRDRREVRIHPLEPGTELMLGDARALLRWLPTG